MKKKTIRIISFLLATLMIFSTFASIISVNATGDDIFYEIEKILGVDEINRRLSLLEAR